MKTRVALTAAAIAATALGSVMLAGAAQAAPQKTTKAPTPVYDSHWGNSGCHHGATPVTFPKRQTVAWLDEGDPWDDKPVGKVGKRTVDAGETVCQLAWTLGPVGVTETDGVVTGISTPGYPTVADIKALGLTQDTPVADNVWLPRPNEAASEGRFPDVIRPVRSWVNEDLRAKGVPLQNAVMVEWEIVGGDGISVDNRGGGDIDGKNTATKLNPNGSVRVIQNNFVCYHGTNSGTADISSRIEKDFGQADLPESMTDGWGDMNVDWSPAIGDRSVTAQFGSSWTGIPLLNGI